MPDKVFLETFPLYRWLAGCSWYSLDQVPKPTINMHCSICKSSQTFVMVNEYFEAQKNAQIIDQAQRAIYRCIGCRGFDYVFLIEFDKQQNRIRKVGQTPPWDIEVESGLQSRLGNFVGVYRKGLTLESQSYGIGAFAYYRRIVEEIIDDLLDEIPSLMSGDELARYTAALGRTKQTRVTSDKIDLIKDLLPAILRPGGMNPLSILHDTLSEGLHARTDDECVALAKTTRETLVFLINQLITTRNSAKTFTDSMRTLLERGKSNQAAEKK